MRKFLPALLIFAIIYFSNYSFPQTGKISGVVTDSISNEPLIGVNVIIAGTTMGAASNIDGFYSIINVPPGTYTIKASMIGYAPLTVKDVRVNIDQTTNLDLRLVEQSIITEEVVVVAQAPIVQKDISSSRFNLNAEEISSLPVVRTDQVIGLQAGVTIGAEGAINIRGGSSDQTTFIVNGITMRDERSNTPITRISFTSVEEIQIQSGGFNAEYGNIRSGLVNIVTKEGKKDKYNFSIISRIRPPDKKYFGDPPNSPNSYWIRPYIDPAVAWTGTKNGVWDDYTQRQYQEFRGWNTVAKELASDGDPTNDLTPEQAQRLFLWQHRKVFDIVRPDYDIDMSFSGPVPFVSEPLGNLRFLFSYTTQREMYAIPLSKDNYRDYAYQMRLTSDITNGMKLSIDGMIGRQIGTNSSRTGEPGIFRATSMMNDVDFRSGASYLDARVFATDYWSPTKVDNNMFGGKFTHVLSPNTFYEVVFSRVASEYNTNPGRWRDTSKIYQIGNIFVDEAPFGYYSGQTSGIGSSMNMGLGYSNSIDSSKVAVYSIRADMASQIDKYNYIKTGIEFIYTDNNVNYATYEPSLPSYNVNSKWHTFPIRLAFYVQDKLEFEGMIANLGIRIDYSDPGGKWYKLLSPFDRALSGTYSLGLDTLVEKVSVDKKVYLSPRLGIAFPITVNSKLYFNYGHFRNMPIPDQLYLLRRSVVRNEVVRIADPNIDLPLTIAYELGYEHNLFDMFLFKIAGYYKDVSKQPRLVWYTSRDNSVNYQIPEPNSYVDIRGFEITLTKNRGDWVRGFVNYTYMSTKSGYFGLRNYYENPTLQRDEERNTREFYQEKPVAQPYARANIDLFTPINFGPSIGSIKPLQDIHVNILASYSSGRHFSWTGPGGVRQGYENNIKWKDYFNVDLRISKEIRFKPITFEVFCDISNLFNIKYMDYQGGFINLQDWDDYMTSLHLPDDIAGQFHYGNIPGDDKPGDYRKGPYIPWDDNASESQKEEWRKNKSYIDMPNLSYATFLNPRSVFWGIRLNVEL